MPNPFFLLCDSDVLIQLLSTKQILLLRDLTRLYGIQATIVPEVEVEVCWHRKFGDRFQQNLDKAIHANVIARYNEKLLAQLCGVGSQHIDASIQQLGAEYGKRVGRGEAYTFAAATILRQPAFSHDRDALDTLMASGLQVPTTVLRVFDLLALHYQTGLLTEAACDHVRQEILKVPTEFVPRAFRNSSFRDGLRNFVPRLQDCAFPPVGMPAPGTGPALYATPIVLAKV